MPELTRPRVPVIVCLYIYLCLCNDISHGASCSFTMGISGKQEVMQHCSMVLYLKWNFGQISKR